MGAGGSWVIREDAGRPVLLALYLREVLGIGAPVALPRLRGVGATSPPSDDLRALALEAQWLDLWAMTIEPEQHPSPVPLALVDEYGTGLALATSGAAELTAAVPRHAEAARAWVEWSHQRYTSDSRSRRGDAYRAYAGTIAQHERVVGRRAYSFELNVQVLPFDQTGVWWIGTNSIAVTDSLRSDAAAFDAALHPIIAQLA
ncbi:zinc-binding alcohol dehydrogenase [Agromyces seonyuensis]|uniref:Zinc-binding alcohol dehydrogenase n=1 Tax=Agromyces seonyuensis TaxID=2662446 RepID=A0A6I4NSP9_9MICO|nr:zinc-binding alcohol dehydrogenase [Agromyces seonyuensis]MWB97283.1 zinc-binding alcohol dehydrogenase [Agromyces seonyuensis]